MQKRSKVHFALAGSMVRSGRKVSTIGFNDSRREPPEHLVKDQPGKGGSPCCIGPNAPGRPAGNRSSQAGWTLGCSISVRSNAVVPDDLQAALDANKKAKAFFATIDGRNRYAVLFRIQNSKKHETRAKKIAQFVEMLANGEKLHP
jgi:hypothetical protein